MQKYSIHDYFGKYPKEFISPNTFVEPLSKIQLILRTRAKVLPGQTKHYLLKRDKPTDKATYFSALWSSTTTNKEGFFQFIISDTQRVKGRCIISDTFIVIQPL